ncbi:MAG: pentapeptide repeat-containing protein [Bacteroidales bacterium]|nr:pentapeptide repeat-containing protein [Bacteroidales bacterium]
MIEIKNIQGETIATVEGDDTRFAKLSELDLRNADLRGWKLTFAYLRDTKLEGADLRGADLRCADFSEYQISLATTDSTTLLPEEEHCHACV